MYCILIKVSNTCEKRFQENRSEHIIYFVRVLMMPQLKILIIQPIIGAFSRKTFKIINLHLKRHCKPKNTRPLTLDCELLFRLDPRRGADEILWLFSPLSGRVRCPGLYLFLLLSLIVLYSHRH